MPSEQAESLRANWRSEEAKNLLKKIVTAIQKGEPWDELLTQRPNYFFDAKDLGGAGLSGVQFPGLNLEGVMFDYADLNGANFEGAYLKGCSFIGADLREANLRNAFLEGVKFGLSDLSGADLSGASLRWAHFGLSNLFETNFSHADLENANFKFAKHTQEANFEGIDLSKLRFLSLS